MNMSLKKKCCQPRNVSVNSLGCSCAVRIGGYYNPSPRNGVRRTSRYQLADTKAEGLKAYQGLYLGPTRN